MEMAKTNHDQVIKLPDFVMSVLRWHVDKQLVTRDMERSELLFPAETGGFRNNSALAKPFRTVAKATGLKKQISPKAMRRSFKTQCAKPRWCRFAGSWGPALVRSAKSERACRTDACQSRGIETSRLTKLAMAITCRAPLGAPMIQLSRLAQERPGAAQGALAVRQICF